MFRNLIAITTGTILLTLGLLNTTARADVWHFTCRLDGSQVTPPTDTEAWGTATLRYDDRTNRLDADIYLEGIAMADWTAAHIHIGRVGYSGSWNIQLGPVDEWFEDGNGIRRILRNEHYPQEDESWILTDGAFIMVHTVNWPSGEIRGQVIAAPRLSVTSVSRGRPAVFHVTGVEAGESVVYLSSYDGVGRGPSVPQLGGMELDILNPVSNFGSATADATGTAMLVLRVPENVPLYDVAYQAVIRRGDGGADSIKSNTVSTVILP